tara:strand:+ start:17176 stop:22383 length:5208 start_codon:yes stop_codon:yes gene_type:complete
MKKIFLFTTTILLFCSVILTAQPINLSTSNITATTADLDWDASTCSGNVVLHYKEASASWPGNVVNPAVATYALSGLLANTDYEWRVKCAGTSGPNAWSSTQQFTSSVSGPTIDSAFITQPILCFGGFANDEMQINVNQTVPSTPYTCVIGFYAGATTYFISYESTNQTSATQLNLNAFNPNVSYFVRLVDSTAYYNGNGGTASGSSTVGIYDEFGPLIFTQPPQLTASTSVVSSNLCTGDCIAEEDLFISGGTGPYSFTVNSGANINLPSGISTYSFVALCNGTYDIIVTDSNGCSTSPSTTSFTISPINPITPNGSVTVFNQNGFNVSCNGDADGAIFASASGGTGNFTYSLDGVNFQSSSTFSGLSAGSYTVTYKDANGCIETETLNLDEPPPLSGTASIIQDVDCYGFATGELTFLVDPAQPGVPAYQYSLNNGLSYQNSNIFVGLLGDSTYDVMIEDNNGCQYTSSVFLPQPTQINYLSILSDYNGYNITCNGLSDGEITLSANGGAAGFTYSIDANNFQLSGIFSGLSAGFYSVVYKDTNGCTATEQVELVEPGIFTAPFIISNNISCPQECTGAISINPSNSVGQVFYSLDSGIQQTTPFFSGLCGDITQGVYTLDATDENGCTTSTVVSISEPPVFNYSTSSIDESCAPPNGQATINVNSGGTGGYSYIWNTTPQQNTSVANNLSSGNYLVTVTDGNGCSFSESVAVGYSPAFNLSFTTVSPCLGPNSGSATVFTSGATGTLSYQWSDINGPIATGLSATLNNVPIGTYFVDVTDATGCAISGSVDIIDPINPIQFDTIFVSQNSCYGVDDAQIEIIVSGGQQPYSYSNGSAASPQSNPVFGLLAPNSYNITVTDLNGCFIDTIIDIIYPGLLQIDSTHFTNVSCFGAEDAEILAIDVLGGTAPFEYSVNGSSHYTNMAYFNGYGPGTYTVEVYDINNCVAADYIIITEPDELTADISTSGWVFNGNSGLYSYQIKCNGDNSGFADLVINGGTAPYIKSIYDAATGVLLNSTYTNSFIDIYAGEYIFEVVDINGCTYSENILFSQPDPILHSFVPTHVSCEGWNNGSLTDIVSGGVGNSGTYSYIWNTGDTTYTINNLGIGTYTITVYDENNCMSQAAFNINDNNALSVISTFQDVTCFDYCDGEITAVVSGGAPNFDINGNPIYLYSWNDILSQSSQTAVGLCVDNTTNTTEYNCIVSDAQGCIDTVTVSISQPSQLIVSAIVTSNYNLEDISCYGENDGALQASSTGGNSPYDYFWSNNFDQQNVLTSNNSNLIAGTYTVNIKDSKGCMDTTSITLNEPPQLTLTVNQTNINCYGIFDGTITADANGGTPFNGIPPEYNYSFSSGYSNQIDISTDVNLSPGVYTVTATDQNGCSVESESIFISQPSDILTLELDVQHENCNASDGEINLLVEGGTTPYNYQWNTGQNLALITSLAPGDYFVMVEDKNGCVIYDTARIIASDEVFLPGNIASFDTTICLGTDFVLNVDEKLGFTYVWSYENEVIFNKTINNLTSDQADIIVTPTNYLDIYTLTITDPGCALSYDVTASLNVDFIDPLIISTPDVEYGDYPVVLSGENLQLSSGNLNCDEYNWRWDGNNVVSNSGEININNVESSEWYYLYVKDSDGCQGYDSIYVVVGVLPYDAITPNGDGYNDTWTPLDITEYENALVQVFNRWGGLVFESVGGEQYTPWDGTNNGKELVVGTYYYIIDLNTGDEPQTGPVTIIR